MINHKTYLLFNGKGIHKGCFYDEAMSLLQSGGWFDVSNYRNGEIRLFKREADKPVTKKEPVTEELVDKAPPIFSNYSKVNRRKVRSKNVTASN